MVMMLGLRSMLESAVGRLITDRNVSLFSTNWSLMIVMGTTLDWKEFNDGLNVITWDTTDSKSLSSPVAAKKYESML